MNTANMPNYLANLQRQGVSPAERSRMAQILGNCAQPLTHRGGMNVAGATHFTNNGSSYAGDTIYNGGDTSIYNGGDITTNINDNTSVNNSFFDNSFSQEFYDQRTTLNTTNNNTNNFDFSSKTWNTHEYGDIINTIEMYQQLYETIYNEGDVTNHYNDNRIWDMRDFSQTTNNTFHQHIQEGDTFSFPTTNEFTENNFFNGPTIINEGDVINKRLVINEGDTIINEGDTTITYEGDSYESHFHAGDIINNTYNNRNTYVNNRYVTTENHFHQQINNYINQYFTTQQFFNTFITILNGGLLPFLQVGPFIDCASNLKVSETVNATIGVPTVTPTILTNLHITGTPGCDSEGNLTKGTLAVGGTVRLGTPTITNTPTPVTFKIDAPVTGKTCSMVSGPGLTQGASGMV